MNTNILTEIYRIHEIMGLKKNLLLEGPTKYIENFFNAIKNKTAEFNDLRKKIVTTGFGTSNTSEFFSKWFDDFLKASDQSKKTDLLEKLFVKLNDEAIETDIFNKFSKFFLGEGEVNSQNYYELFMTGFLEKYPKFSEKQVITRWSTLSSEEFSQEMKTIFQRDPFTQSLIEPFIRKQIASLKENKFRTLIVPKRTPYTLSETQIEKLNLKITSYGQSAKVFFMPLKDLYVRNLEQLKESVQAVNAGFIDSLKNAKEADKAKIINAYAVRINQLVNLYTKKIGDDYKTFLTDLDIEDELYNKITNPSETDGYFWAWRQTREGADVISAIQQELKAIWDDIRFKGFFKQTTTSGGNIITNWKLDNRFLSLFLTGQSSPLQAWFRRFIVNGGLRGPVPFMKFIVKQFFYSNIISIGASFAGLFLETVTELVWGVMVGQDGTIGGKPFKSDWNKSDADDFINKLKDLVWTNISTRVENVKEAPNWALALTIIPGGLATIQEGWFQLLFVDAFRSSDERGTFFDLIGMEKELGLLTPEEEEAGKDVAPDVGTPVRTDDSPPRVPDENPGTSQIPQDLLDVMNDEKENQLIRDGENIYWGSTDYPIKKAQNGVWRVYSNGSWYDINTDM